MFLRERHELEQKIGTLQDMLERSGDEEQVFIIFHGTSLAGDPADLGKLNKKLFT